MGRIAPIVAVLLLAGCTSNNPAAAPSPRPSSSFEVSAVAYTSCLRTHGVAASPPTYSKNGSIVRWLDLPPNLSPKVLSAAEAACADQLPKLDHAGTQSSETTKFLAAATRFVTCMRANGVPKMPDPTEEGIILKGSGVDPTTSKFKAAERKCKHFLDGVTR